MSKPIYISVDIEADGPIPGPNSMLSIGAAAFQAESRKPLSTFTANLERLPGAMPDPDTMDWWDKQPDAWAEATRDPKNPAVAMRKFVEWLEGLPGKPTFVGYPASYDQMWAHWYAIRFVGRDPLGFSGIDIKTMASTLLCRPFREVSKRSMPKEWFRGCPKHTHKALDDAIGQGIMFINMLAVLRGGAGAEPDGDEPGPPVIGHDNDGTPLYEGRIPIEDRPHVGEVWERMGDELTIIEVDPYGRSFEYTRERDQWQPDGTLGKVTVKGTLGQSDLEGPNKATRVKEAT